MAVDSSAGIPSPALLLETAVAYRRAAALRTAIELDIFSALADAPLDAATLAARLGVATRGIRILCDALATLGFVHKESARYSLSPEAALFLNRASPVCMADAFLFLSSPHIENAFRELTAAVRRGGTSFDAANVLAPEHEFWLHFARAMAPMMAYPADSIAQLLGAGNGHPWQVLDVAAGHGMFGIAVARQNPNATITALDWPGVLAIARANAEAAGVASRFRALPGSAFALDFGTGYDLVLLTNFLHHFDSATNEALLRKVHAALVPGGRAAALEFVPDEDRTSPPFAALFSLNMLVHTPAGEAYTLSDLERMFRNAGFASCEYHSLPPSPQGVVIASR
ncbi:MAG TPA: class I SAM-dependent methyltransferase [Candidatus Acidoferrales bacterium]|nr:class I SAM-dependent methyltransferase [Candidatus Acidoferrales bacterium]